jgi:hypothetical protein
MLNEEEMILVEKDKELKRFKNLIFE